MKPNPNSKVMAGCYVLLACFFSILISGCASITTYTKTSQGGIYFKDGLTLLERKKYDDAASSFQEVISLEPDNATGYYYLGITRFWQEKYDDAILAYKQVVRLESSQIDPHYKNVYYFIATAFLLQKNYEAAIPYYRQSVRAEPENFHALVGLGTCFAQTGNISEARTTFKEFLSLAATASSSVRAQLSSSGVVASAEQNLKRLENGQNLKVITPPQPQNMPQSSIID